MRSAEIDSFLRITQHTAHLAVYISSGPPSSTSTLSCSSKVITPDFVGWSPSVSRC